MANGLNFDSRIGPLQLEPLSQDILNQIRRSETQASSPPGIQNQANRYEFMFFHPDTAQPVPGTQDDINLKGYASFVQLFGRKPTASEFAQVLPSFQGEQGLVNGPAFLVQFKEAFDRSPEQLAKRAPEFAGDVNRVFQDLLERGADQDELDFFGRQLATGQITPFELKSFVRQLPEFRKQQDVEFRKDVQEELQPFAEEAFEKGQEQIISRFAKAGRSASPALDVALTDLLGDITKERDRFLAGTSFQQFQGNKALARADFENTLNQFLGNRDFNRNRRLGLQDLFTQRGFDQLDFAQQQAAFERLANAQKGGGPSRFQQSALGGLSGAGALAPLGGPAAFGGFAAGALLPFLFNE